MHASQNSYLTLPRLSAFFIMALEYESHQELAAVVYQSHTGDAPKALAVDDELLATLPSESSVYEDLEESARQAANRRLPFEFFKLLDNYVKIDPALRSPDPLHVFKDHWETFIPVLCSALRSAPYFRVPPDTIKNQEAIAFIEAIEVSVSLKDKKSLQTLLPKYLDRAEVRSRCGGKNNDHLILDTLTSDLVGQFSIVKILDWIHGADIPDNLRNILALQLRETAPDVRVTIRNEVYACSQTVLSYSSGWFNQNKNEICLDFEEPLYGPMDMKPVLDFAYSGKYTPDEERNHVEIFSAADYVCCKSLQSQILNSISLDDHLAALKAGGLPEMYRGGLEQYLKEKGHKLESLLE